MDATPTTTGFDSPEPGAQATEVRERAGGEMLLGQWLALHEAAAAVAGIAGITAEPLDGEARGFPATVSAAGGWRCELARQGIEDISAMLEPGLSALLAACSRGADCAAPAKALWHEFVAARDALLAMAPPE